MLQSQLKPAPGVGSRSSRSAVNVQCSAGTKVKQSLGNSGKGAAQMMMQQYSSSSFLNSAGLKLNVMRGAKAQPGRKPSTFAGR